MCVGACNYKRLQLPDCRSHSLQILPTPKNLRPLVWLYPAWYSTTLQRGGNSASSCFSWHKVWNGVKCNFSSAHHHVRNVVGKLSISWVQMWNFTRIGPKTKKLWLSIIPARTLSDQPSLGTAQKGMNYHFSSPELHKPYIVGELSIPEA